MKTKPKEYYTYETPKIAILWNGKTQPVGLFKSLSDALHMVEILEQNRNFDLWQIRTPEHTFHVREFIKPDNEQYIPPHPHAQYGGRYE